MVVSIDFSEDELLQIQRATGDSDPAAAVASAAREFVRVSLLKQLKTVSGKVEFDLDWRELDEAELGELPE